MKFKTSGDLDDFPNSNAHYRGIHIAMFEYRHSNPKGPCCPCFWQRWTMLNQWNTQWSRFQWNTTETQTAQHAVAPGSGNIQGDTISSNPSFRRRQKHSEVMGHSSNANDQRLLQFVTLVIARACTSTCWRVHEIWRHVPHIDQQIMVYIGIGISWTTVAIHSRCPCHLGGLWHLGRSQVFKGYLDGCFVFALKMNRFVGVFTQFEFETMPNLIYWL